MLYKKRKKKKKKKEQEREDNPTCNQSPMFFFSSASSCKQVPLDLFVSYDCFFYRLYPIKALIYVYMYLIPPLKMYLYIFFLEEFHRSLQHFVVIIIYGLLSDNRKVNQFRLLLILGKSDLLMSIFETDTISEGLIIVAS